jgi:CMP-N,N'-diacetyllegionaminic acid synthase
LDHTSLLENIFHFNNQVGQSIEFKYYVILQPTSPLRRKKDIFEALKTFNKKKLESLCSISPSFEHPYDTLSMSHGKLKPFQSKNISRRQLYPESFYINGAIYIFNKNLLKTNNIFSKKNMAIKE